MDCPIGDPERTGVEAGRESKAENGRLQMASLLVVKSSSFPAAAEHLKQINLPINQIDPSR